MSFSWFGQNEVEREILYLCVNFCCYQTYYEETYVPFFQRLQTAFFGQVIQKSSDSTFEAQK